MGSSTYNKRGGSKAPILRELQTALANHLQNIGYLELVWAYVKRCVPSQFKLGRSMSELRQHTLQGFYGDGDKHIGVTSDYTLKIIKHVHDVINRYIKEDVQLHGTIDKLIVKSSSVVIDSPDIINDQVNELDVFMGEMEDAYEEQEKMEDERRS
ncbi:unnamed protein product [Rotaria sp. Silwood2]|nr:unnamed protein product [Rotaria sp. Silwood2]